MAVTESNITVTNATQLTYNFTFPYLKTTDVKVSINGVAKTFLTHWEFDNATTIKLNSNPTVGDKIRIYRETDDSKLEATFFAGSAIKSSDLNDNFNQNLYVTQESNNKIDAAWTSGDETIDSDETWASNNTRIATTGAIDSRVDSKIDTALTTDVAAGNKITVTDNSPGSGQITIGVTSGSLVNSDINASAAIAGTKISPDFGSQNIATTGTVDGRDVSADGSKLDGIETGATADQTNAEIRAAVEAASDSNVFTDADHTKLNAIEPNATADQTAAEIRTLVESASDSNVFTDADHTKLNAIEANATADQTAGEIKTLLQSDKLTASEIANGTITATQIATGALDGRYYTETESDARYFNVSTGDTIKDGDTFPDNDTTIATTAAINDRIIDLVDDVGGFVPIANETSFPNANPDVNNGAGTLVSIKTLASNLTSNGSGVATIANGTVGNSTVTITGLDNSTTYNSGFGMIVETTTTLNTYAFHRLVPKATEVSTVAGSISNVNTVGNSIANVNTVANDLNETTSEIDTVANAITNVNNVGNSIANVNTVASNINSVNNFSDVYRVSSSAPSTHLHEGDLYFDTTGNELKVYNGSAWQGGVTATGNLLSKSGDEMTGNLTFSGSQTVDGRDLSVDGAKLDGIEAGATADQTKSDIDALNIDADTLDGVQGSSYLRSDTNDTFSGVLTIDSSTHRKLYLSGSSSPAIFLQEGTTNKAHIQWSDDGNFYVWNEEYNRGFQLSSSPKWYNGSGYQTLWHAGNDGSGSGLDADTVDGIHGASFVRSDQGDTLSGQYTFGGSNNEKITLAGVNNPFIRWQQGTTNKAYIEWTSSLTSLRLKNTVDQATLLIRDNLSFSTDGSNYNTVWHAGNDGSGSGLDADTLDGVQGASYLRSDTDDTFTGELTLNNVKLYQNGNVTQNLTLRGYNSQGSNDVGISAFNNNNTWCFQLYGTNSGTPYYGFLDGNWNSWDIKKQPSGIFEVDEGSGLRRVLNQGNVGSGGAISGTSVYVSELYASAASGIHNSGWEYFENTTAGLYWNGGSAAGFHFHPTSTEFMRCRSGANGAVGIDMNTNGVTRGYFYANSSSSIGILNSSTNWLFKCDPSGSTATVFNQHLYTNTDSTYDLGSSSTRWRDVWCDNVMDSKGDLRRTGHVNSSSQYTFGATESGNTIACSSGGWLLHSSFNNSGAGSMVTIINNSGSDQTLAISSGVTLYNTADGSTGSRTLAARGMATIYHAGSGVYYISGSGLS